MDAYQGREKLRLEILESPEEKRHFHQNIELLYILQGTLAVTVESHTSHMKKDDILIINANRQHELKGSTHIMYLKLTISYEMISDVLKDTNVMLVCDSANHASEREAYDGLRRLLQKLLSHFISTHENVADFLHISLCYQIMDYLTRNFLVRKSALIGETASDKYEERIREINDYIYMNFRLPISIKDLSERMHLSDGYLSRFFKKNYGMSFAEYVSNVRLQHALEELLYSDFPITRIAYDNGFANVGLFNKAFKKEYGMTPSQMRKESGTAKPVTKFLSRETEERVSDALWLDFPDDSEKPGEETERLDFSAGKEYDPYWSDTVNIGLAADLMRSDVREHVLFLKSALNFRYVRFWNPFSKELLIDVNSQDRRYNFTQIDSILDYLLSIDVKPYIELASKPERLQGTAHTSLLYDLHEKAASLESWRSVVDAFLNHILQRYGTETVAAWRFEFWFDIDNLKDVYQVAFYIEELRTILEGFHGKCNARIGAAGLHALTVQTPEKTEAVRKFLNMMVEESAIPDYLTYYSYSYDTKLNNGVSEESTRSSDADYVLHSVQLLRRILPEEMKKIPIFISEWNLTVSDRNAINDSCFKGAYIVKNYIDLLGKVDGMAYFRGTDILAEYYDSSHVLFGGSGLLTRDGVMKPAAFAYDFLNRLYPYLVAKGRHYIATTNNAGHFGIVCHNLKELNYHYYHVEEDRIDGRHLNRYFDDVNPLTVHFVLENAPDGWYQVKTYRINSYTGSVQQIWEKMEYEDDLSREDIKYIRRACEPGLSMKKAEVKNGRADLFVTLDANEIAYIRMRRITER